MLKHRKDGLLLQIKISPNSSKNLIIKDEAGIKIKLTAQPIEGKANKALIEFLSKQLKIPGSERLCVPRSMLPGELRQRL